MQARQPATSAHPLSGALARLTTEETFHDVVFVVGEERIGAVRNLVAARCEHWERAFYGQCRESTEHEVVVGETDPQSFRHLLHFIYTDQLHAAFDPPRADEAGKAKHEPPFDQLFALWELAERYNLPDLKALLRDRLQDHLVITQPVWLLELVDGRPDELCEQLAGAFEVAFMSNVGLLCLLETLDRVLELCPVSDKRPRLKRVLDGARAACVRWIGDHGRELMSELVKEEQQQGWIHASATLVEAVLSCQMWDVYELQVFRALAAWWRHDVEGRTVAAREMVPRVLRMQLLTYSDLADFVEPTGLLSMEQLMNSYKIVARHARISCSHTLVPGCAVREARTHDARGREWKFLLKVSAAGQLGIAPTSLGLKQTPFTAFVCVGRVCEELALTTDTTKYLDVSAFTGSSTATTMVTILFCYPN